MFNSPLKQCHDFPRNLKGQHVVNLLTTMTQLASYEDSVSQLRETLANDKLLADKIARLVDSRDKLTPLSKNYDYEDNEANGVRTFTYTIETFIRKCARGLRTAPNGDSTTRRVNDVVDILLVMCELYEDAVLHNRSIPDRDYVHKILSISEQQYLSLVKFGFFYMTPEVAKSQRQFGFLLAVGLKKWSAVFSASSRRRLTAWFMSQANGAEVLQVLAVAESKLVARVARRKFPCDQVGNVQIKCHSKHQLQADGTIIAKDVENEVTCQVIRHGSSDEFNDVLIYQVRRHRFDRCYIH